MSKQYFVELIAKVNRHSHAWPAFVKFSKRVRQQRALIRKLLTCYLTDISRGSRIFEKRGLQISTDHAYFSQRICIVKWPRLLKP